MQQMQDGVENMRKETIIIFLILLSSIVIAADVPRERLVTTNFTISGVTWIDNPTCNPDTNETTGNPLINLTINTQDLGNNNIINIGPTGNFGNQQYIITFSQWLSCEDVLDNILLNETVDMFSSCDGQNCKTAYFDCNSSKQTVENNKAELDTKLAQCQQDLNDCNANYSIAKASAELLPNRDTTISTLQTENANLKGQPWLFGLGGLIAGALLYYLIFVRTKTKSNDRDEIRAGRTISPENHEWKKQWDKEEEEMKARKAGKTPKGEVPEFKM